MVRAVKKRLTQINKGVKGVNVPYYLVVHFVGASGQARANAEYFEFTYREASAHYFIDPNETYMVVEDDTPAWHVGDGAYSGKGSYNGYVKSGYATNTNSLGFELCQDTSTGNNVWEWQFHPKTYQEALKLIKSKQLQYNIPDHRVIRHFDVSGKSCPGNWMKNDWAMWHQFKRDLKALDTSVVPTPPKGTPKPPVDDGKVPVRNMYTIKPGDTLWAIANKHKTTVAKLREWNNIEGDLIFPETKIFATEPVTDTKPNVLGVKQLGKLVPVTGSFVFNTVVNVRNQPAAYGATPAQYYKGETVKYTSVSLQNGHIWLAYTSHDGKSRYVSAGTPSVAYGTFK